jgi:PAS domain-containing protein
VLPGLSAVTLEIPFELPSRDVKSIARLKSKLTALLPGKVETFRFGDLEEANQVEKRIAGVTVVLEQVRKNRAVWEIRLAVRFDEAGDALESHRTWIYDNEIYLEAADGESTEWATFETTRQTEDEVGAAYYFAVDGPLTGYTLVYKTPALILSKEIEYEIGGIDLP